jgi:drug/metabolite transporter (DMT)-like permease
MRVSARLAAIASASPPPPTGAPRREARGARADEVDGATSALESIKEVTGDLEGGTRATRGRCDRRAPEVGAFRNRRPKAIGRNRFFTASSFFATRAPQISRTINPGGCCRVGGAATPHTRWRAPFFALGVRGEARARAPRLFSPPRREGARVLSAIFLPGIVTGARDEITGVGNSGPRSAMAPLPRLAPRLPPARREDSRASDPTRRSYVKGALWSLLYVAFSTAIILSNKHIITETNFRCPIAVSSLGSVFGWLVSLAAVGSGFVQLKTRLTFTQWCVHVLPIGVCTAVSLAFANLAYVYLDLSFIQMIKAFAPVVTFATLVFFKLDTYDANVAMTLAVIVAGCFTASFQRMEAKSVRIGLACMFACEVAEAFRSAGMQYLLGARQSRAREKKSSAKAADKKRDDEIGGEKKPSFSLFDGMYYFSPATLIFLAFLTYVFEWDDVTDPAHVLAARKNPAPFALASTLGFFVNLASLAVIQHLGSMTLKIVSQLKNVVVICAAVVVYDDNVSLLELLGYAVAIFGFGMYQDAKDRAAEFARLEEEARGGEFKALVSRDG